MLQTFGMDELEVLKKEAMNIEYKLNYIPSIRQIDSNFISFNTGKNLRKQTHSTMLEAEKSLDILINLTDRHVNELFDNTTNFYSLINQVNNAGSLVRVILEINSKFNRSKLIHNLESFSDNIKIRYQGLVQTFFYVIDASTVLVKIVDPITGNFDFASISIREKSLAKTFKQKFNLMWNRSEKLII